MLTNYFSIWIQQNGKTQCPKKGKKHHGKKEQWSDSSVQGIVSQTP